MKSAPTLFIRYIANQDEAYFIEQNYEQIIRTLNKDCHDNSILFICNSDITIDRDKVGLSYSVVPDENDWVARDFLDNIPELKNFLLDSTRLSEKEIKKNILFSLKKAKKKKNKNRFRWITSKFLGHWSKNKVIYKHSKLVD